MDLARLRFGDWVMAAGGVAVLVVMFLDWFERGGASGNAWESFAVNDAILALAALLALCAFVLTVVHPTAAVPLALSSLATLIAILALVLVALRLVFPPDLGGPEALDTTRATGAWLGLVATTLLVGGCLASIRDERLPRPKRPVEPRLIRP
jgi:hypothetical protein